MKNKSDREKKNFTKIILLFLIFIFNIISITLAALFDRAVQFEKKNAVDIFQKNY